MIDAGDPPEQVAADHDPDIADVHRGLAYYDDHPDEMRAVRARRGAIPDDLTPVRGPEDLDGPEEEKPEPDA